MAEWQGRVFKLTIIQENRTTLTHAAIELMINYVLTMGLPVTSDNPSHFVRLKQWWMVRKKFQLHIDGKKVCDIFLILFGEM